MRRHLPTMRSIPQRTPHSAVRCVQVSRSPGLLAARENFLAQARNCKGNVGPCQLLPDSPIPIAIATSVAAPPDRQLPILTAPIGITQIAWGMNSYTWSRPGDECPCQFLLNIFLVLLSCTASAAAPPFITEARQRVIINTGEAAATSGTEIEETASRKLGWTITATPSPQITSAQPRTQTISPRSPLRYLPPSPSRQVGAHKLGRAPEQAPKHHPASESLLR